MLNSFKVNSEPPKSTFPQYTVNLVERLQKIREIGEKAFFEEEEMIDRLNELGYNFTPCIKFNFT